MKHLKHIYEIVGDTTPWATSNRLGINNDPSPKLKENESYKVWFGIISDEQQAKILEYLHSIGFSNRQLVCRFDSLYLSFYRQQWSYSYMGSQLGEITDGKLQQDLQFFNNHNYIELDKNMFM